MPDWGKTFQITRLKREISASATPIPYSVIIWLIRDFWPFYMLMFIPVLLAILTRNKRPYLISKQYFRPLFISFKTLLVVLQRLWILFLAYHSLKLMFEKTIALTSLTRRCLTTLFVIKNCKHQKNFKFWEESRAAKTCYCSLCSRKNRPRQLCKPVFLHLLTKTNFERIVVW